MTENLKLTPLVESHKKLGGRMVPFAGWLMPVQYEGLIQEHQRTRTDVGLFDVSHMGELRIRGAKSLETLQWLTTNDVANLKAGQAQYSLFGNADGGIVDDLIVYCIEPTKEYFLCVNAANKDKDFKHCLANNRGAEITDESDSWGQIAVQGPKAIQLLQRIFGDEISQIKTFEFAQKAFSKSVCYIARTGYTGEDGAEIFVPKAETLPLWQMLLEKGQDLGVGPIGLGARDTLRTEMKYSLYGNEINDSSNPYSAGLGWVVKPKAKDFLGKDQMLAGKEQALQNQLIGFEIVDKGIPRPGYRILDKEGRQIGHVTSGTHSPSLNKPIGVGYIDRRWADLGSEIFVDVRGRPVRSKVVKTPFVTSTSLLNKK